MSFLIIGSIYTAFLAHCQLLWQQQHRVCWVVYGGGSGGKKLIAIIMACFILSSIPLNCSIDALLCSCNQHIILWVSLIVAHRFPELWQPIFLTINFRDSTLQKLNVSLVFDAPFTAINHQSVSCPFYQIDLVSGEFLTPKPHFDNATVAASGILFEPTF